MLVPDDATTAYDRHGSDHLDRWIYDHLLPHTEELTVAHPLTLRLIAAATKKNDKIDAGETAEVEMRLRLGVLYVLYVLDGDP